MGKIQAICSSDVRGIAKSVIPEGRFKVDWGLEGDAHAGHWHRQVSLLGLESIEDFRRRGGNVEFGAFGENLVVDGFIFSKLPVGTLLRCGDVLLEITQIGKACHSHCAVYEAVGDCIMPREGVFAKVLEGGVIHPGDEMVEVERGEKRPYQAAVITLSDKGSQGLRQDESGPVIVKRLEQEGYDVVEKILLPDGRDELEQHLRRLADQRQVDLILTTGGTGFGQRDNKWLFLDVDLIDDGAVTDEGHLDSQGQGIGSLGMGRHIAGRFFIRILRRCCQSDTADRSCRHDQAAGLFQRVCDFHITSHLLSYIIHRNDGSGHGLCQWVRHGRFLQRHKF